MAPLIGFGRGVILIIMTFGALTCLAENNVTVNNHNSTQVDKTEEGTEGLFSTEFKIFLGLAAFATLVAIIACAYIRKKGEQYARGDNLPSPIVGLSHKF